MWRNPEVQSGLIAVMAGAFGGTARWYQHKLFGKQFRFWPFIGDMILSAGIGLLIFWCIIEFDGHQSLAAMGAAIGGNVGSRFFDIIQVALRSRMGIEGGTDNGAEDEAR